MNKLENKFSELVEKCHKHETSLKQRFKIVYNPFKGIKNANLTEIILNERSEFENDFKKIQALSNTTNAYFTFCSLKVYKANYNNRLVDFLEHNENTYELDFIETESSNLRTTFEYTPKYLKAYASEIFSERIQFLDTKKRAFLSNTKPSSKVIKSKNQGLSNFYAVRILDHFGVIDSLLERGHTQEKISKILGEILGKHHQNIRSEITDRSKPTTKEKEKKLKDLFDRFDNL